MTRDRMLALLRDLEWKGTKPVTRLDACPSCRQRYDHDHAPDCTLAQMIAELEAAAILNTRTFDEALAIIVSEVAHLNHLAETARDGIFPLSTSDLGALTVAVEDLQREADTIKAGNVAAWASRDHCLRAANETMDDLRKAEARIAELEAPAPAVPFDMAIVPQRPAKHPTTHGRMMDLATDEAAAPPPTSPSLLSVQISREAVEALRSHVERRESGSVMHAVDAADLLARDLADLLKEKP